METLYSVVSPVGEPVDKKAGITLRLLVLNGKTVCKEFRCL